MTLSIEPGLKVDTNVVSYVMRGDSRAKLYLPHLQGKILSISFITVGEMFYGAKKNQFVGEYGSL